jgi:uncharacterized protein YecE (DUF72 family)
MAGGCQYRIGTSGWHYKHWVGDFYPQRFAAAGMLERYAKEFDTVEINNSFYRLPEERTFRTWKTTVGPGFLFAVKASRFITHIKKLKDSEAAIHLLMERCRPLGTSLGPVLFQLPPNWKVNLERLDAFLQVLPPGFQAAVEFRDPSWNNDQVFALLRQHNVALCIHDWREMPWPEELTADFAYVRFHGSGQRYGGSYPEEALRNWSEKLRRWGRSLGQAFIYFNNDIGGHAFRNARTLREMLAESAQSSGLHSAA